MVRWCGLVGCEGGRGGRGGEGKGRGPHHLNVADLDGGSNGSAEDAGDQEDGGDGELHGCSAASGA